MPSSALRPAVATTVASLLVFAALAGPAQAAKSTKTVNASSSLRALVTATQKLPATATSARSRARLLRRARRALRVARRTPCTAVRQLASYRGVLRAAKLSGRVKGAKARTRMRARLAALGPVSLKASGRLLADRRTKSCGGGVIASSLKAPRTRVLRNDVNGMSLRVELPALRYAAQTGGGRSWTELSIPNAGGAGGVGDPGIPVLSSSFAVPDGAKVAVTPGATESYEIDGVDVYPTQPEPVDQGLNNPARPDFLKPPFAQPPFQIDGAAYENDSLVPAAAASGRVLGQARDVTIGALQIPAAQYDAADRTLKVLNSVDVKVTFEGGPKTFSDEIGSPWEQPQRAFATALINAAVVKPKLVFVPRRCGEEMLVITNPATRVAADLFAVAKRAQGWRTNVFETGGGAGQIGTTPAQIQTFIRGRLTALLCVHPSYVTIMGDDDLVPTFTDGPSGIPSDLKYSLKTDADELPDLAIGRILGNDQAAVNTAVTKIIGYETTAPTGHGMLTKALVAAQFQDDDNDGQENRTFITMAETVRNGLNARGVAVDRVYGESPGNNPQRFQDGSPLPAALLKANGFGWNGTGAQVSAGWNEGRFMVVHRDHGWSDGWGTPGYGTADVQALTNGDRLPVVLSVNCSSGAYDYDETSFASEALVKAGGGAVGVFGDTRDSPSTANTQMSLGFVDALLPSVLPVEGPAVKQRTGDALNWGKLRLNGIAPLPNGTTRSEFYLWHYYGDPSMQMWGGGNAPIVINPALVQAVFTTKPPAPGDPPFEVNVAGLAAIAGQPVSLLQNGQVIGKAFVGADGKAAIAPSFGDGSVKPGELEIGADGQGVQPFKVPVTGVPPVTTTLTQSCPADTVLSGNLPAGTITVTGTLAGAPAGATVAVTFDGSDAIAPRTVTVNATTDAAGGWTASLPVARSDQGDWIVSSAYGATAQYAGSQAGPCTINVHVS